MDKHLIYQNSARYANKMRNSWAETPFDNIWKTKILIKTQQSKWPFSIAAKFGSGTWQQKYPAGRPARCASGERIHNFTYQH